MKKVKYIIKTREQVIRQRLIVYSIILIILGILSLLCLKTYKKTEAISQIEEKKEEVIVNEKMNIPENKNKIKILENLKINTENKNKKTLDVDEVDLDYMTEYIQNDKLPTGTIQVKQEGEDGKQKVIIIKTYKGEEYINEERIQGEILSQAKNKIVEIGTGEGVNNYNPKEGDYIYATPEKVTIREAANRKANEIAEMKKDDKALILKVVNQNWLKIQYSTNIGFVDSACFTNINPFGEIVASDFKEGVEYTKDALKGSLDFNMDLRNPSGLTLAQFKKVLTGNSQDKQNVIGSNAEFFYYAERMYGINGIYLAAMAIHEGGWGTSKIADDKKNLFGYGSYDSNPYEGSYNFNSYAEGIDLVARNLVKNYLNPKGTEIYDGQIAKGTYYNGPTLTGVNTRYASDKNWANAVFKWMTYLYDRL